MNRELEARQDAGQLVPDVSDPEDRHDRPDGERLEQHSHHAAAALPAVLVVRMFIEPKVECLGYPTRAGQHLAGPGDGSGLEIAAADAAPGAVGADDHL